MVLVEKNLVSLSLTWSLFQTRENLQYDIHDQPLMKIYQMSYSELNRNKNDNIQVILSKIHDQKAHQVPKNLPHAFYFGDIRRYDSIKPKNCKI